MHAYDLARLETESVRLAKPGERLTLLDDKEYVSIPASWSLRMRIARLE